MVKKAIARLQLFCSMNTFVCLTSIEVLVDSFQPSDVVVCVRHQVDVQHVRFDGGTCLENGVKHSST